MNKDMLTLIVMSIILFLIMIVNVVAIIQGSATITMSVSLIFGVFCWFVLVMLILAEREDGE